MLMGSLLLLAGTLLACRAYSDYKSEGVYLSRAFLDYLVHIRLGINGYSKTLSEARRGYESEELERCGFLPALESGVSHTDAFSSVATASMPSEIKGALEEYFTLSGRRFLEDELSALTKCIERVEKLLPEAEDKVGKDRKAVYAVGLAICLGLIILVI